MTRKQDPVQPSPIAAAKKRLRAAIKVLRDEAAPSASRGKALKFVCSLGEEAKSALLVVVAALDDKEETNRSLAFEAFSRLCPEFDLAFAQELKAALASRHQKDRLEAIRKLVTISPVQEARAGGAPGWRFLRQLIAQDGRQTAKEGSVRPAKSQEVDPAIFYDLLPTNRREPDDPVVQAMRENPGRWITWNEATHGRGICCRKRLR